VSDVVIASTAPQHWPMHFLSRARLQAGVIAFSMLALFVLAPGASITFAAAASGDFDHSTIYHENTHGIIMRDGGVCDPIRHMGC